MTYEISISPNSGDINPYWDYTTSFPNTTTYYNYSYTATIYMYELNCPRCKHRNWGEIDKIIECKGKIGKRNCGAKLKAVSQIVDYEVPVG